MLSLSKLLPGLGSAVNGALRNSARSIYSASYLGIDSFNAYAQRFQQENALNSITIKQTVKEAVAKPDGKLFTEDLKSYLYQAQTDEEIDTLVEAIQKYQNQQSASIFSFNFDGPLMRLLYSLNKTDKALALYLKDGSHFFNKSFKVTTMLMNKLIEDKRFDDALKVGDLYIKHHKTVKQAAAPNTKEAMLGLGNIMRLYTEALLGKNDSDSLQIAKKFLKDIKELNQGILDKSIAHILMLALEQNDPEFAFEISNQFSEQNEVKDNLKILTLISLKRTDEALNLAEKLSKQKQPKPNMSIFFRSTLEKLQKAVESDTDKKNRVQTLFDTMTASNAFFKQDLKEFLVPVINKRRAPRQQQQGGAFRYGSQGAANQGGQNQQFQQRFNNDNRQQQQKQQGQQRQFNDKRSQQQQQQQQQQKRNLIQ